MSDPNERLTSARKDAGFKSAAEAAERFGWKYPTYAGHENGSRGLTVEAARDYSRAFRTTPEWLLFGTGSEPQLPATTEHALVSVFDVAASAGDGSFVDYEPQVGALAFPADYLRHLTSTPPSRLAIISVKGESMEPTLLDDDIVLMDGSKTSLAFDGLFVLQMDGALHVKRVARGSRPGAVMILSDNRAVYPPVERQIADVHVIGKVLWYGRKV